MPRSKRRARFRFARRTGLHYEPENRHRRPKDYSYPRQITCPVQLGVAPSLSRHLANLSIAASQPRSRGTIRGSCIDAYNSPRSTSDLSETGRALEEASRRQPRRRIDGRRDGAEQRWAKISARGGSIPSSRIVLGPRIAPGTFDK